MRRVVLSIVGALLILVGSGAAFGGALLVGVFGGDGRVDTPTFRLTTSASALTSDVARFDADLPDGAELATVHLSATSLTGGSTFIGIGPARQVLAYLAGSSYDVVTGVDGRRDAATLRRVGGDAAPPPPTTETFWVAQTFGTGAQTLDWTIANGSFLAVVMNTDGSPDIDVQARVGVSADWPVPIGVGLLGGGVLVLILGAVVLGLGVRTPRPAPTAPVYAQPGAPPLVGPTAAPPPMAAPAATVAPPPADATPATPDAPTAPEAPPRQAEPGQ